MSKKVRFYLILDLVGIGITLLVRAVLCGKLSGVSEPLLQSGFIIIVNVASVAICVFIVFFFLLYWWSDRKWTALKRKFKKKK